VADAVDELLTVRRKVPLGTPVPVRGRRVGELGSELEMVRVLLRWPRAVGVKVMVAVQEALGPRVMGLQGTVMA
jgi:hypothetical protein